MPGIKRYFPVVQRYGKRYKYVASSGSNFSSYRPSSVTRLRRRRTFKPRRAFTSIRRHRGRRRNGKSRGLTIAKVLRALTPLNTASYSVAGKAVVGGPSNNYGPQCVYYIPNNRVSVTTFGGSGTGTYVFSGSKVINGTGNTQFFPSSLDATEIGYRISNVDGNTSVQSTNFFSPSEKFYMGNYSCKTRMVNQSNGQAVVTVFSCVVRKDIPSSQSSMYFLISNGILEKLTNSDSAQSYPVGSGATYTDDFMRDDTLSLFDSVKFTTYCKVVGKKTFVMNAGDIKLNYLSSKGMKIMRPTMFNSITSGQTWRTSATDIVAVKGSVFQVFRVTGQPTNDSVNKDYLGLTSPAIDFIHEYKFQYRYVTETGATTTRLGVSGFSNVSAPDVMTEQGNVVAVGVNA